MLKLTSKEDIDNFANEILNKRNKRLESKINKWPRKHTIASDIPICSRQGVYSILNWDERKMHDATLQARFDKGIQEEANLIKELVDLGYEVIEQQVPLAKDMTDKYNLSGKIDGKLKFNGSRIPFEVKSMNPFSYNKVGTLDDVKGDIFMSRYYRQMQVYLLGHNEEFGLFFFTDCLGHWKIVPCPLDYQEGENILKKVEEISKHVVERTLPVRIPYDSVICGYCAFNHICLPDIINESKVKFENNVEFESMLKRRGELQPAVKEFEELDDKIKNSVKEMPMVSIGNWLITGKWQERKTFNIPELIKKQYEVVKKYWITKISKQGEIDS